MMHAEDAGGRVFMPFDYSPSGATRGGGDPLFVRLAGHAASR